MGKPPLSPNLREKPPESMHTQFRDMLALKLARNPVKTPVPQLAGNCCRSNAFALALVEINACQERGFKGHRSSEAQKLRSSEAQKLTGSLIRTSDPLSLCDRSLTTLQGL